METFMFRRSLLALAAVLSMSLAASATPTIIAGTHELQPNTPGQAFQILVSDNSGDQVLGVDLYLLVADGLTGPVMTSVDLVGPGTIFNGNANPQSDFGAPYVAPSRHIVALTTTLSGTVAPNGVLANVIVDTTGVAPGDYAFSLSSPFFGDSDLPPFAGGNPTILVDGVLRVVPEPSAIVMALFAAAGMTVAVIRRRVRRTL